MQGPAVKSTNAYLPGIGSGAGSPHRTLRRWIATAALAISDGLVFAFAALLLRSAAGLPALVLFRGSSRSGFQVDEFTILVALFIIVSYIFGDYSKRVPFWDSTRRCTTALLILGLLDTLSIAVMGQTRILLSAVAMWLLLLVAMPLARQSTKRALGALGFWKIRTILIGSGNHVEEVVRALDGSIGLGFDVRSIVLTDQRELAGTFTGRHVFAMSEPLTISRFAADTGCTQAVLAMDDLPRMSEVMQFLIGLNFDVTVIPPFRRLPLFGMSSNVFFGQDIVLLQMRNNLARIPSRTFKRLVDLIGSLVLIVLLLPLFAVLAIMIQRDDPGPAFFVQKRVGRGGREFNCLKFRTMKVDAERILQSWERDQPNLLERYRASNFKLADDPRVTSIGRWLRRTSMDELPQLVNVLLGQMSLTGPRPLLPREIPFYGMALELYQRVRPGITGLWQISGRSNTTFRDRVMYDEWYIKNWSAWYDIVIMLKTVRVVFSRDSGAL